MRRGNRIEDSPMLWVTAPRTAVTLHLVIFQLIWPHRNTKPITEARSILSPDTALPWQSKPSGLLWIVFNFQRSIHPCRLWSVAMTARLSVGLCHHAIQCSVHLPTVESCSFSSGHSYLKIICEGNVRGKSTSVSKAQAPIRVLSLPVICSHAGW